MNDDLTALADDNRYKALKTLDLVAASLNDFQPYDTDNHQRHLATMRTIGHRKEHPITFSASAALLLEGARFNDEIHRLPTGNSTFIPKGLFRFKSHEEANQHQQACLIQCISQIARERS